MLRFFPRLPALVYFMLAGVLIYIGTIAGQADQDRAAERALALQNPVPAVIDLGQFSLDDAHLAGEVHVALQINYAYNYRLVKGAGTDRNARAMWVAFDPSATRDNKTAQAAIVVDDADREKFSTWLAAQIKGAGNVSPIFNINGIGRENTAYASLASDALTDEGLRRGPDFFFIEPFTDGRAAGLGPRDTNGMTLQQILNVLALFLILCGGVKIWICIGRWRSRVLVA